MTRKPLLTLGLIGLSCLALVGCSSSQSVAEACAISNNNKRLNTITTDFSQVTQSIISTGDIESATTLIDELTSSLRSTTDKICNGR